jgi:hypothetical protein
MISSSSASSPGYQLPDLSYLFPNSTAGGGDVPMAEFVFPTGGTSADEFQLGPPEALWSLDASSTSCPSLFCPPESLMPELETASAVVLPHEDGGNGVECSGGVLGGAHRSNSVPADMYFTQFDF